MTEGVASSEALERLFEKSSMAIVVVSVLFTAAMMQVLMDFPGFTTEISSFAPESDSDSAEDRINEEMGHTRIYFTSMSGHTVNRQMEEMLVMTRNVMCWRWAPYSSYLLI